MRIKIGLWEDLEMLAKVFEKFTIFVMIWMLFSLIFRIIGEGNYIMFAFIDGSILLSGVMILYSHYKWRKSKELIEHGRDKVTKRAEQGKKA